MILIRSPKKCAELEASAVKTATHPMEDEVAEVRTELTAQGQQLQQVQQLAQLLAQVTQQRTASEHGRKQDHRNRSKPVWSVLENRRRPRSAVAKLRNWKQRTPQKTTKSRQEKLCPVPERSQIELARAGPGLVAKPTLEWAGASV